MDLGGAAMRAEGNTLIHKGPALGALLLHGFNKLQERGD